MKLATIKSSNPRNRFGQLVLVSKDNSKQLRVSAEWGSSLLEAVQNWATAYGDLAKRSELLNEGKVEAIEPVQWDAFLAPLPIAPGFYDGSAFLSHVHRARRSRGDVMPESAKVTPLMYQGVSDNLLPHNAPIELMDPAFGGDFEGEFFVVTDDVPKAAAADTLDSHMILFGMLNDITYREIIKTELPTKFGFLQSKPNSSFAPFLVTPDELGAAWSDGRIKGAIEVKFNGERFGDPDGREMHFSFNQLVAHAARTRPLSAGSIVGTGTVSNEDKAKGFACLTEKRFQEILDDGKESTPWLKRGDRVFMDFKLNGVSVFGTIDQTVV